MGYNKKISLTFEKKKIDKFRPDFLGTPLLTINLIPILRKFISDYIHLEFLANFKDFFKQVTKNLGHLKHFFYFLQIYTGNPEWTIFYRLRSADY